MFSRFFRVRGTAIWAATILASVMVAACGSAANNTTSGGATAVAATQTPPKAQATKAPLANAKDYCSLISIAEIQASINKSVVVAFPPSVITRGNTTKVACAFGLTLTQFPVIDIEFFFAVQGTAADQYAALKPTFASTTPIANLGDEAYIGIPPPSKTPNEDIAIAVVVKKGAFFFFVGQFADTDAATVVPADEKIAQLIIART